MTGWGRTGTLLACEQAGVVPDIMCLSKGITGGCGAARRSRCATRARSSRRITRSDRAEDLLPLELSYTANPIACAAAVANLDDLARRAGDRARRRARRSARADGWRASPAIPRSPTPGACGTIAALELRRRNDGYLSGRRPATARVFFVERDLLLRPLGNTVYVMPPYCVTRDDLAAAYAAIRDAADMIGGR